MKVRNRIDKVAIYGGKRSCSADSGGARACVASEAHAEDLLDMCNHQQIRY